MSPEKAKYLATVVNLFTWAVDLPVLTDRERSLARGVLLAAGTDTISAWGDANRHRKDEFRAMLVKIKEQLNAA